ncbi:cobyrinate a,c-diamide synthase [Pseudooceanicola atlanticus]|uniref:Cobyrinic acid a,c-diamide synthase n=1 Tax=Pseudooceanicola atlanticus TaxID=1461694 RepID=A0A0A0EFH5_9RHOB|nr:cobyrinate a,c-diamide synthase [Pseudooceanicola atlanticus]KGM48828.1 cobyrinic acid a,c-diamide synthase [Pseudooceanicola atlanticus]
MKGLILAAPSSGAGKTTITLALLRWLSRNGLAVRAAKSGPDYIDPKFHEAACGQTCLNLDAWAMSPDRLRMLAGGEVPLIIEGAMGLFDGAPPNGRGAVADLARLLDLPVVLIVDAGRMAQSVAPLVAGFAGHDPQVRVAGIILNNVGSARHAGMLRHALEPLGLPVLAVMPRAPDLTMPSRHLGLVQAGERSDLDLFLDHAADRLAAGVDGDIPPGLDRILDLAAPLPDASDGPSLPPPAQRIALARDEAFAFSYPHMLADWHAQGAEILPFSPLADDRVPEADFVFLPGGYPELHAPRIAAASRFLDTLRSHAQSRPVYGECGGYMVLGESLTDADGTSHAMAGLLQLATSFEKRRLHLGYRRLTAQAGPFSGPHMAHEFHYATTLYAHGTPLFEAWDATDTALPPMGLRKGHVAGSFAHVIDRA